MARRVSSRKAKRREDPESLAVEFAVPASLNLTARQVSALEAQFQTFSVGVATGLGNRVDDPRPLKTRTKIKIKTPIRPTNLGAQAVSLDVDGG